MQPDARIKLCAYLTASFIWLAGLFMGAGVALTIYPPKPAPVRDKAMPSSLEYRGPKPEPERLSFTF